VGQAVSERPWAKSSRLSSVTPVARIIRSGNLVAFAPVILWLAKTSHEQVLFAPQYNLIDVTKKLMMRNHEQPKGKPGEL
jgi:hypothetical protein